MYTMLYWGTRSQSRMLNGICGTNLNISNEPTLVVSNMKEVRNRHVIGRSVLLACINVISLSDQISYFTWGSLEVN